jgi:hypothetical protein
LRRDTPRWRDFALTVSADPAYTIADEEIVTFFPAPRSYTTQDVVEISAHGSSVVLRALIEAAVGAGARLARPGEFTLRAYLGGRMDLTQAEAVADLIVSATPMQARAASEQLDGRLARAMAGIHEQLFDLIARLEASLDFPDEGYHFIAAAEASATVEALQTSLQGLIDEPARRGTTGGRQGTARAGERRDDPARLRGGIRLRPADRASVHPGDGARLGAVLCRTGPWDVRLRGSGCSGPCRRLPMLDCRCQERLHGPRAARGLTSMLWLMT